jgi:hypothetical protein
MILAWPGISALALLYLNGAYAVALGTLCVGASRERARSRDGVGASFPFYDRQGEIAE